MTAPSTPARLALAAVLALGAAGCGSNDPDTVGRDPDPGSGELASEVEPVAELSDLDGVATSVALDPLFVTALQGLQLTPATVGGATLAGGAVSFPITAGDVTYYDPDSGVEPYVQGRIGHDGSGLRLTAAGGRVVELTDFVVDAGESVLTGAVTVDGELVDPDAELFFLDGRTLQPLRLDEAEGTATLAGTTVSLTAESAEALNAAFGVDALSAATRVGVAEITVALPD